MNLSELRLALLRRARRPGRIGALLAGAALRVVPQGSGDMEVRLWGRQLRLPATHHLPFIVGNNPFWSMPLVHCVAALAETADCMVTVVDVGANVGDSAVLLDSCLPGRCQYVCVEPNSEWIPYLKANTEGLTIEIISGFVGEGQLLSIRSTAPGSAGSSISPKGDQSIPLDEVCDARQVDLIKIDTDGFDFPILRSGKKTLSSRKPALFFEWDPAMWSAQGEDPEGVFGWLASMGYEDFCFFGDSGHFYCRATSKSIETIRSLLAAAECRQGVDRLYWDVFTASREACDRAVQNNVAAAQKLSSEIRLWNRLQPTHWQ